MISAILTKQDGLITKLSCTGHANFAEHGQDIVCAGVSMILTVTANGIEKFNKLKSVKIDMNSGDATFKVNDTNCETVQLLLENAWDHLTELSKQYPTNIKTKEEN